MKLIIYVKNVITPVKSAVVTTQYLSTEKFAVKNSITAAIAKWLFLGTDDVELLEWENNRKTQHNKSGKSMKLIIYVKNVITPVRLYVKFPLFSHSNNSTSSVPRNNHFFNRSSNQFLTANFFCLINIVLLTTALFLQQQLPFRR